MIFCTRTVKKRHWRGTIRPVWNECERLQVILPNELTAAISGVISRGIRAAEVTQDGHLSS